MLTAALGACSTDPAPADDSPGSERRGPLGKADAVGSCEASDCGGQASDGDCWCDDACDYYGDCCGDKPAVCDGASTFCGGIAGQLCPEGSYCQYDAISGCGFADGGGVCVSKPEACIELFAPVCGCDGETHGNSCKAAQAGVTVATDGECGSDPGAGDSCEDACGGKSGSCWCDDSCEGFGDCCDDFADECASERTVASGQCVRNSGDECQSDADCTGGGCGGELCFNPDVGSGISTCDCSAPTNVDGCGCVNGSCSWFNE